MKNNIENESKYPNKEVAKAAIAHPDALAHPKANAYTARVAAKNQNESVISLIDAIAGADTITSAKLFSDAIMSKVTDMIDARREEVAQSMFNKD